MNIEDICFVDTETRAAPGTSAQDADVTECGTYRYFAAGAFVNVLTFAIGNAPVFDWSLDDGFEHRLDWHAAPLGLKAFHRRVMAGEAWFAAWNAGFDRSAFNSLQGGVAFKPEHFIDIMAQATASNLPPSLQGAALAVGLEGKQDDGKQLIKLFSQPDGGTPFTHMLEWARYKSYGRRDTDQLREVFRRTRPLPMEEWEEYWASERINQRGMAVDLPFVERAAAVADADKQRTNKLLVELTNGKITTVNQSQRIADWLWDHLPYPQVREILTSETVEDPDSEDDLIVTKLSVKRDRIERLIAFLLDLDQREGLTDEDEIALKICELREFGASAAPLKFRTILQQHNDGRLQGQYVFNGAQQTGRFSAKGVQVHNLTRKALGDRNVEAGAIEMINDLELRP